MSKPNPVTTDNRPDSDAPAGRLSSNAVTTGATDYLAAPAAPPTPRTPDYRPFPLDALPAEARDLCREGAAAFDCDAGFIAPACLSVLGAAAGGAFRVVLKAGTWTESPAVWTATVAPTGNIKTGVFKLATAPAERLQDQWVGEHRDALAEHDAEFPRDKRGNRAAAKGAGGSSDGQADQGAPPPEPKLRHAYLKDATTEVMFRILSDQGDPAAGTGIAGRLPSLLWLRSELSGLFGGVGRYGGGRAESDTAALLELFDGTGAKIDRATAPTLYVRAALASITGTIQPSALARCASAGGIDQVSNGLFARFLICRPKPPSGRWTDRDVSKRARNNWAGLVLTLWGFPGTGELLDPKPRKVKLTREARRLFVPFVNANADAVAAERHPAVRAALAKLRGYAARLALVRHAADAAMGRCEDPDRLSAASMAAGIALAEWYENETRRCIALADPAADEVEQRLGLIRHHGGATTVRDWQRRGQFDNAEDARADLRELAEAGHGTLGYGPVPAGGGRQSEVFTLNRPAGNPEAGDAPPPELDLPGDDDDADQDPDEESDEWSDAASPGTPERPTPDNRPDSDAPRGRLSVVTPSPNGNANGHAPEGTPAMEGGRI